VLRPGHQPIGLAHVNELRPAPDPVIGAR